MHDIEECESGKKSEGAQEEGMGKVDDQTEVNLTSAAEKRASRAAGEEMRCSLMQHAPREAGTPGLL